MSGDVVNIIGTWLGVALSAVGFSLATWQIRKTRAAADATRDAVNRNTLVRLITELFRVEAELTAALTSEAPADAATAMVRWRQIASQIHGHAVASPLLTANLEVAITEAIPLVSDAEGLVGRSSTQRRSAVAIARQAISVASSEAGKILAALE